MADETAQLVVQLEARIRDFERNMAKAQKTANDSWTKIEQRNEQAAKKMQSQMAKATEGIASNFTALGGKLSGMVAAAFSGRELIRYADSWTGVINSLKVAGLAGADLTRTLDALYAAAQRQGAPLDALVKLFGSATQSAKELGATRAELITFAEDVGIALRVAGKSPEEASGALLQLSQLLGSSRAQAEEFNSVAEGARPILQAVANGIEEASGSISKLKALVTDGNISNVAFFRGFQAGVQELRDQAASAEPSISQAMIKVQNAIMKMVGEVDRSAGFSRGLVGELSSMAEGFEKATGPIKEVIGLLQKLADLQAYVNQNGLNLGKKINQALFGTDTVEDYLFPTPTQSGGGIGSDRARAPEPPPKPKPIRAADYPVVGAKTKGGSDSADEYERATRSLQEHARMLEAETAAVGRSVYEQERARRVQQLLNAAKEAGRDISSTLRAEIEKEADAYAHAAQNLAEAERKHGQIREIQNEVGETLTRSIGGLITGARTLNDTLSDVLDRLIEIALQGALMGTGPLAGIFGGGNGGGIVGGAFGGFRAEGGPIDPGRAYVVGEKGPEVIVPGRKGSVIPNSALTRASLPLPNLPKMTSGMAAAAPAITFSPTVNMNASGGTHSQNMDLSKQVTRELQLMFRNMMVEEIRRQRRPNGALT